jgi:hypothetical protein
MPGGRLTAFDDARKQPLELVPAKGSPGGQSPIRLELERATGAVRDAR